MKKLLIVGLLSLSTLFASYEVGDKAFDFNLPKLMKSGKVSMSSLKNRVVLLNLWASWCPGCKHEMPFFDTLGKKFAKTKFRLVAVSVDTKMKKGSAYVKKLTKKLGHKPHMTYLYDKKKVMPKAYKAKGFPLTLLIKNGKIIKRYEGAFDENNSDGLVKDIKRALK
jgi:thiol-disulfide isomerase/thioredoxin